MNNRDYFTLQDNARYEDEADEDYVNMLETLIGIASLNQVDVADFVERTMELANDCLNNLKHPAGIKHNAEMFRS